MANTLTDVSISTSGDSIVDPTIPNTETDALTCAVIGPIRTYGNQNITVEWELDRTATTQVCMQVDESSTGLIPWHPKPLIGADEISLDQTWSMTVDSDRHGSWNFTTNAPYFRLRFWGIDATSDKFSARITSMS